MSHKAAKQARKLVKTNPLNDPKQWSTEIRPPYFDRRVFQMRLDLRAGRNKDGKSILVLRWAPEVITTMFDARMPRYWVSRIKDGENYLYICPPRWVIERRLEREQYADSWNRTRYVEQGDGTWLDKGPPPEDYYIFTWLCAEHSPVDPSTGQRKCCEDAYQDGRRQCWGIYREPNDYDLQCVEAAIRRRDEEEFIDPYAPLTTHDIAVIEAASGMQMDRVAREAEKRAQDILRDQRILSEVGGTFHDVGKSHEKSLIYTPN